MPRWWLVIGSPKNWQTAFEQGNLWGLKESQQALWEHIDKDDLLLFYASSPVSGIIGLGSLQSKFIQDIPLWPDEVKINKVLWPLRLEMNVLFCWPQESWRGNRVVTDALMNQVRRRQMLQVVEENLAKEILASFPEEVATLLEAETERPSSGDLHDDTISQLLEIGSLQSFIAEKEYNVEIGRVDVVWRRVARSVPNYVFEVHVGGSLDRDLAKLKHAYDMWNSNIFLISTPEERGRVEGLLAGAFHEIRGRLKFIDISTIDELSQRKRSVRDLERDLGIL